MPLWLVTFHAEAPTGGGETGLALEGLPIYGLCQAPSTGPR